MSAPLNRRAFIGAATAVPLAICGLPATATSATPFRVAEAHYRMAMARFNGLPGNLEKTDPAAHAREERAFLDAVEAVDKTPASTWDEFADAYEIACDGGDSLPSEDLVYKLLADVRRLKAGGLS